VEIILLHRCGQVNWLPPQLLRLFPQILGFRQLRLKFRGPVSKWHWV
jgi:hypothetical protein